MSGFVTVLTVYDTTLALVARTMLQSAGLTCRLADEHLAGIDWLYIRAIGGIRIQVPAEEAEEAARIMGEEFRPETLNPAQDGLDSATRQGLADHDLCPHCRSQDIDRCNLKRLSMLIWGATGIFIFFTLKWRKCRACGRRWKWRFKLGLS